MLIEQCDDVVPERSFDVRILVLEGHQLLMLEPSDQLFGACDAHLGLLVVQSSTQLVVCAFWLLDVPQACLVAKATLGGVDREFGDDWCQGSREVVGRLRGSQ